jgi:hypothetical protein
MHCGEDLELADDEKTVACKNQCDVLVVGPPEPAPRVRQKPVPAICDRCQLPIVRKPGYTGRTPKHHDECRTPRELAHTEYMRQWNERERHKKAQGGGA